MALGEWDRRELCPDGGCVGLIGADGLCKVCGRAATNWGNERDRGLKADTEQDADLEDEEDDDEYEDGDEEGGDDDDDDEYEDDDEVDPLDAELDPSTPSLIGEPAEWNARQLCIDGACIGVIGEDGTCKVCGKLRPGAAKKHAATATTPDAAVATPTPAATPPTPAPALTPSEDAELLAAATALAASAHEDFDRKLCPDGACVGVIGDDGHCKLCGKVAA